MQDLIIISRDDKNHLCDYTSAALLDVMNDIEFGREKSGKKDAIREVLEAISKERERQDAKWGEQNHPLPMWTGILGEEYGELCQAINETVFDNGTDLGGYENMLREAIHVAAVAVAFAEFIVRNKDACDNMCPHGANWVDCSDCRHD